MVAIGGLGLITSTMGLGIGQSREISKIAFLLYTELKAFWKLIKHNVSSLLCFCISSVICHRARMKSWNALF